MKAQLIEKDWKRIINRYFTQKLREKNKLISPPIYILLFNFKTII